MSHFKGPSHKDELPNFRQEVSCLKMLHEAFKKNGDTVAIIEGWSGKEIRFKDYLKQSTMVAAGLRALGVTAGDYVLFCCDKSIMVYSLLLGTLFTGATAVHFPIPHADNVPKMVHGKTIKVVFSDPEHFHTLSKSIAKLPVQPLLMAKIDPEDEELKALMKPTEELEVYDVVDPTKHVAIILYSSGTTGIPKAIQVTDTCLQLIGHFSRNVVNRFLISSPFYWLSGSALFMSSALQNYTVLMSNSSDAKTNLELIQKYKVDVWFTGTGSMTKYINEPTLPKFDLSSVKKVHVGGESVLSCVFKDFSSKVLAGKIPIEVLYGSTEMGMVSSICKEAHEDHFPGVCGKPFAGVEIKIMEDKGTLAPLGVLGEVYIKTVGRTAGYWARPDLDREAFDQEGFFRTGDAGFFDAKGILHLRGRKADLITFKGIKISSMECEDILMAHPGVLDVAVVGRPHPTDNEHLTAFVVRIPGSDVSEQELLQLVNGTVSDELRLRGGVHFIQIMPRTIIGKIQRKLLKDLPLKELINGY